MKPQLIIISITVFSSLGIAPAQSQVIPDGTTNTSVTDSCQDICNITGGTTAGQNLFHSFEEFGIPQGGSAYFAAPGVANIFSRVTGHNSSDIFGTLGVTGAANLFLLNPNGIVFGNGAALDLNGSLFATTADEIQFGDRNFTASPSQSEDLALLTINPSAFLFNQVSESGLIRLNKVNLTVPEAQNITLLGRGDSQSGIELNDSKIAVYQGNINLGAVSRLGEIALADNLLQFPDNIVRGDVTLSMGSAIEAKNSGRISIDVRNLNIAEDSSISSITEGDFKSADIQINAQESVKITGLLSNAFQQFLGANLSLGGNADPTQSRIQTATTGRGDAGNIAIEADNLSVENGAGIFSTTRDLGQSGDISLNVAENLTLRQSGLLSASGTLSLGDVGKININTKQLSIRDRAVISSSTLGNGNAGKISINATERVEISDSDTPANSIIPTGIFTNTIFGSGTGGNLEINTSQLVVRDGSQLSASNGAIVSNESGVSVISFGGAGGNVELNATESIKIGGLSQDERFTSSIVSNTRTSSPAGNLTIDTTNLFVDANGLISASSLGTGLGGDINITAKDAIAIKGVGANNLQALIVDGLINQLDPDNIRGGIAAFTIESGAAGNITLDTGSLSLDDGAIISTATYGADNAGDLQINASEAINVRGSAIISPTFDTADGGMLNLNTKNLSIIEGGTVASASVGSGKAGNLNISATESIAIFDVLPNVLFSGSISTGSYSGLGSSGDLQIDTERLIVRGGANIQANNIFITPTATDDTVSQASPGKLTINAAESVEISGSATETNPFNQIPNSHISSLTTTSNPASNVTINTSKLAIFDRGEINVSSFGRGMAGTLEINAESVSLQNEARLSGTTNSGLGGNIALKIQDLLSLEDRAVINTDAAMGSGGNIDINAEFAVASGNSSISANAAATGNGGEINITANDVFLTKNSTISADSALGIDGTVKVQTLIDSEGNSYLELPQQAIQTDSRIIKSCGSNGNRQGIFSYTGRGGLPISPLTEFKPNSITLADLEIPPKTATENLDEVDRHSGLIPTAIVEANNWRVNPKGEIELTAASNTTAFDPNPTHCPFSS